MLAYLVLAPSLLFFFAGTLRWTMAWVYVLVLVALTLGSRLAAWRRFPDLLAERGSFGHAGDVKPWDRGLVLVIGLLGPAALSVVAGIDPRDARPPPVPQALPGLGLAGLIAGYALGTWAMLSNRFFSAVARIQTDRGQHVVTSGPYRFLRHPSYAGGILACVALPLMLDAICALAPGAIVILVPIVRTSMEDRVLIEELPGYRQSAAATVHRLVPGVW
jgi:protein-S-isoprenylcysteine O-methyltransferase Ste14